MINDIIKITIEQNDGIAVTLPYNPVYIEKLKGIKGHR